MSDEISAVSLAQQLSTSGVAHVDGAGYQEPSPCMQSGDCPKGKEHTATLAWKIVRSSNGKIVGVVA